MGTMMGSKGRVSDNRKETLDNIKEVKDSYLIRQSTQSCGNVRHKMQKQVESCRAINTMEKGTPRDSALPVAKCVGDEGRPTNLRPCACQIRGSNKARNH